MHTGPTRIDIDPDIIIECDSADDSDSDGLTDRERFELRCWEMRCDGDPVADRVLA